MSVGFVYLHLTLTLCICALFPLHSQKSEGSGLKGIKSNLHVYFKASYSWCLAILILISILIQYFINNLHC